VLPCPTYVGGKAERAIRWCPWVRINGSISFFVAFMLVPNTSARIIGPITELYQNVLKQKSFPPSSLGSAPKRFFIRVTPTRLIRQQNAVTLVGLVLARDPSCANKHHHRCWLRSTDYVLYSMSMQYWPQCHSRQ